MSLLHRIIPSAVVAASIAAVRSTSVFAQSISAGVEAARGNGQPSDLFLEGGVFQNLVNVMLFLIGAIAVIMIIIAGLRYVTSGGNAANVTAAKNTVLYAIVGVVVAILSYAAVQFVVTSFSANGTTGL